MAFDWGQLAGELPNLLCLVVFLNAISFSLRGVTFGPLLLETRRRRPQRHFPLSDLVALMLVLQLAAAAALAIGQRPGVDWITLAWHAPLEPITTASIMIVFLSLSAWWWFDSSRMLNAAEVKSGWTRFVFLVWWTPVAYLSSCFIFFGGCIVLVTIASRRSGIRWTENTIRIDSIAYIGLFAFTCLTLGIAGVVSTRWWANRLADESFDNRMSSFRRQMREQEKQRAAENRAALREEIGELNLIGSDGDSDSPAGEQVDASDAGSERSETRESGQRADAIEEGEEDGKST